MPSVVINGVTFELPQDDSQFAKVPQYNAVLMALAEDVAWTPWTPTWANWAIGNAVVNCAYQQIGKTVLCRMSIVFGSSSTYVGDPTFTLPVTRAALGGSEFVTPLGVASLYDNSGGVIYPCTVHSATTTTALFRVFNASGTYTTEVALSSTVPFTWTNPDEIAATFSYEAA